MTRRRLIVFTGIDGSGKTTLANQVTHHLRERGVDAIYVHGRSRLILSKPLATIGRKVFLEHARDDIGYEEDTRRKKGLFGRHTLLGRGYEFVLLFDTLTQLWMSVGFQLARGRSVVCDRYYYDTIITDMSVDMDYSENGIRRRIEILGGLLPTPHLTFLIDIDEEVAAARKDDIQSVEYLRDRRKNYLSIAPRSSTVTINGEKEPTQLLDECLRRIADELDH